MAQGAAVRRVDIPLDRVWAAVADHHRMAKWLPGMSVELERNGDPDAGGVGAVRAISAPGHRVTEEVTAYLPGRRLAYKALSGAPLRDWAGEVEMVEHQGGTVVRWSLTAAPNFPGANAFLHTAATLMLKATLRTVD